jgi:hypothetical protein
VAGGALRAGSEVLALPSGQKSRVRSIVTYDGEQQEAFSPMSVTLTLEDEIDLSRGDLLVSPEEPPSISRNFEAMVVWFHADPLVLGRTYLIKHNVRASRAKATKIRFRVNMHTLEHEAAPELRMNDIAAVEFEAATPLFFDSYHRNRITGSFILIDPLSNATVGAAMIERELPANASDGLVAGARAADLSSPVADEERYARHGHQPALVLVRNRPQVAGYLERALFAQGFEVAHVSADEFPANHLRAVLKLARSAGLVVILSSASAQPDIQLFLKTPAAERPFDFVFDLSDQDLPEDDGEAVAAVLSLLSKLRAGRPRG